MAKSDKKEIWFVPVRGSYLPKSWQGGLAYLLMVAYCVLVIAYSINRIDSAVMIILLVVPNFVAVGVFMHWLAWQKS